MVNSFLFVEFFFLLTLLVDRVVPGTFQLSFISILPGGASSFSQSIFLDKPMRYQFFYIIFVLVFNSLQAHIPVLRHWGPLIAFLYTSFHVN